MEEILDSDFVPSEAVIPVTSPTDKTEEILNSDFVPTPTNPPEVELLNSKINRMSPTFRDAYITNSNGKPIADKLKVADKYLKQQFPDEEPQEETVRLRDVPKRALGNILDLTKGAGALAFGGLKTLGRTYRMGFRNLVGNEQGAEEDRQALMETIDAVDKAVPQVVKGQIEQYQKYAGRDPVTGQQGVPLVGKTARQAIMKDPVFAALDILPVGQIAGKAAKATKLGGLAKAGEILETVSTPTKYIPTAKEYIANLSPTMKATFEAKALEKTAQEIIDTQRITEKVNVNKTAREIKDTFTKLTDEDFENYVSYIQNPALKPANPSKELNDAISYWQKMNAKDQEFLVKHNFLRQSSVDTAKYIPIIMDRYKKPIEMINKKTDKAYFKEMKDVLQVNEKGMDELVQSIKKELDEQPTYFPQFAPDQRPLSTRLGLGSPATQAFQKKRSGMAYLKDTYEKDPIKALTRLESGIERLRTYQRIMDDIKAMPETEVLVGPTPKPGYVIFDPNGYGRLLKDELKVHSDLATSLKAGETLETALQGSVDNMIPKVLPVVPKDEVLYQIPKSVAKALESKIGKPTSGIGYAFDKATDYWKSVVLYTRPKYYVNQAVGNGVMYTVSGGTPKGLVLAATKAGKAAVPEQLRIGSFHTSDVATKYYSSNDGLMKKLVAELENTAPARGITKIRDFGRGVATNIDNYYRDAKFLDVATKLTQKKIMLETNKRFTNSMELIERIGKQADPEIIKQAIDETEKWMGDFKGMTPIERDLARRLIPFWGFTKHQLKLLKNITLDDPLRGKMIETMNQVGELATPPERREHFRNGDVYLYTDAEGTDHYLQTRYMNPLVIAGFGVDVFNPVFLAPIEYLGNVDIVKGQPRTSPFVVKKEDPLTNKTTYLRIVDRNGKVRFEETHFVNTPMEFVNDKFNPYARLIKNIAKTKELESGERPQTKYSILLSKDIPEQLMSFAFMNTVMDNPQLTELSKLSSFERAYKQIETNLKKEPKLQKMMDENPDLMEELKQYYIPNDDVEMIE